MKLFSYGKDGGQDSTVWGFWLIEWKRLLSIALLCFENGSRDAFHSHAFHSVSWVLGGQLNEITRHSNDARSCRRYRPSFRWIWTPRSRMHMVVSVGRSWVLTIRGPWRDQWQEYLPQEQRLRTLTHGRLEVAV